MAMEKIDYAAILADAEAKKSALEAYIASIRNAIALGALNQGSEAPLAGNVTSNAIELPVGALLNKSIPAAIKLYLGSVKKKQTIQQIVAALQDGGVESTSSNFDRIVQASLTRLKASKEVLRFKDGWGLAELYPDHIRKSITEESKPAKKKSKKKSTANKTKAQAKASQEKAAGPSVVVPITANEGLFQKIGTVLNSDTTKSFSAQEIAATLGVGINSVVMSLGRLAKAHKAEKCSDGKYRALREKVQKAS